jgi:hypothetical protein
MDATKTKVCDYIVGDLLDRGIEASVCFERGHPTENRFGLIDIPLRTSLGSIAHLIARHRNIDTLPHSNYGNDQKFSRFYHGEHDLVAISITRSGRRILVNIDSSHPTL